METRRKTLDMCFECRDCKSIHGGCEADGASSPDIGNKDVVMELELAPNEVHELAVRRKESASECAATSRVLDSTLRAVSCAVVVFAFLPAKALLVRRLCW